MRRRILCSLTLLLLSAATATADPPEAVNYQGVVLDGAGIPIDGSADFVVRIYDDEVSSDASALLFEESHAGVGLISGVFQIDIGIGTPVPPTTAGDFGEDLFGGSDRWLEIEIDGEILVPRQPFVSNAFALQAGNSKRLGGLTRAELVAAAISQVDEKDPQVGSLVAGRACGSDGSQVICNAPPGALEVDPQVGNLAPDGVCTSDGSEVSCTASFPVETDPQVGSIGNGNVCLGDSGKVSCTAQFPEEVDPEVGTVLNGSVCQGAGGQVVCDLDPADHSHAQASWVGGGSAEPTLTVKNQLADPGVHALYVRGPAGVEAFLGVQGADDFAGVSDLDLAGLDIGLLGVSDGSGAADNIGVYGYSTGDAGFFQGDVHVTGDLTVDGSSPVPTRTGKSLLIPAQAFVSENSSVTRITDWREGAYLQDPNGTTSLVAPVVLPVGSRMIQFALYYQDDFPGGDLEASLYSMPVDSAAPFRVSRISSAGSAGYGGTSDFELDVEVVERSSYFVEVYPANGGTWPDTSTFALPQYGVKAIKIRYEPPEF